MKILVTMKCGHKEYKEIFGSTKEREKKIWYFENCCKCEACEKKAREEANAKAAEESKELNLVELSGSEKQVAWANSIRSRMIKEFEEELSSYEDSKNYDVKKIVLTFINTKTYAYWFIDNRDSMVSLIVKSEDFKKVLNQVINGVTETEVVEKAEEPVVEEDVVKIKISGDYVNVFYKKDNRFVSRMHYYLFTWDYENKCWYKKVYVKGHTVQDLAAEIYKDLSNCGFKIICEDDVVIEKATNRTYKTENEVKEELKIAKEKEEKERIVEITYSDFKNDVWSEKIEKQVYNSYDSNKKTIKIVVKTIKDRKEIEDFYKEKKSKIPQEIRDFKDGLTDHFEIVPETINAEELDIDVPWELRNNK